MENERTVTGMDNLIDRDALIADIAASVVFSGKNSRNAEIRSANKIIDRIKTAQTVDAEPVKHGRWELVEYQCTPVVCGNKSVEDCPVHEDDDNA